MGVERTERTYRLEPLDTSGVFLGLGLAQCALVGGAMVAAVAAITAGVPLAAAVMPIGAGVAAAFGRVGGYRLWEWSGLAARWLWTGRAGRRWHAPLPLVTSTPGAPPLPPCLDGLEICAVDWHGPGRLGAIADGHRHTLTAVVPVTGPQFVVEPRSEQERLLAGWGDVLGQFAVEGGPVIHLSWSDLARPSGLGDHLAWINDDPPRELNVDAARSYRELLQVGTETAISHDVVVTITVARDRLGRRHRGAGNADERLARALGSAVDALLRGLRTANLTAGEPLDPAGIGQLVRLHVDPVPRRRPSTGRLAERLALTTPHAVGPMVLESAWSHLRVDAAWHRTWWIATWPRLAVPPGWMEPFLSTGGVTRTMTVVLAPVSTYRSRRRIERDLVKLDSDAVTKADQGRRVDAQHRRATQALLDREDELVAGYPEMGYAGLVTVSAPNADTLDEHSEIIEQLAREHGMDLRVLDARQDLAWACALPLGLAPGVLFGS